MRVPFEMSEADAAEEFDRLFSGVRVAERRVCADRDGRCPAHDADVCEICPGATLAGKLAPVVEIGERIRTEDDRATSHPIFLVESRDRIYGISTDYATQFAWIDEDGREADPDLAAAYEENHQAGRDGTGMKEYARVGYVDRWKFATACLTEDGAKAYIAANGHNLKAPRIYVASGYRNLEWQAVRAFLLSLAGGES